MKLFLLIPLNVITAIAFAQETTDKIEMADALRESGKIYVVVGVLVVIFIGIVVFLINMDRKVAKLEKEIRT